MTDEGSADTEPASTSAPSETRSEPSISSVTDTAPVDTGVDSVPGTDPPPEPDRTGLRVVTHPAMGGIRMGLPEDLHIASEGEMIVLHRPDEDGRVVIARVSKTEMGLPIGTVDDFIDIVENRGGEVAEAGDEPTDLFDADFVGYDIRFADGPPGPGIFPSRPSGFDSNVGWSPGPLAEVWVGDVIDGVLAVAAIAETDEGLERAVALRDTIVPTLSLTTSDGRPGPIASAGDAAETVGRPTPFTPPVVDPDGPLTLDETYTALEPGSYQLTSLPRLMTIDVPEGWVIARNLPGFVVFFDPPLIAPSARDLVFQVGANALTGTNVGPTTNTDPIEIPDLEALRRLLADPPDTLTASNVDETVVGGVPALRFELRVDPSATCREGSPCFFLLSSPSREFGKWLDPGIIHRIWWIDGGDAPPIVISASTAEADEQWLDTRIQEFISQIRFD